MPRYCKAYRLEDLRKFPKWSDVAAGGEKELEDDSIVYIVESFDVTKNCLELDKKEDYILTDAGDDWQKFATSELKFEVPDWEAESERVREAIKKQEEEGKSETND